MRILFLAICCFFITVFLKAQDAATILSEFRVADGIITSSPCSTGHGMIISNRAMNIFLSNKIGSYLSEMNDLSFYKNNVLINTVKGTLSVNHNFFQPSGADEQMRSFLVVGAKANIANAYSAAFNDKQFNNEFGFNVKYTWVAEAKSSFEGCAQKQAMNAQIAAIIHTLENEINGKETEYEKALDRIQSSEIPGQDINEVKLTLKQKFYSDLKEEYSRKFADLQSSALIETKNYKLIKTNWTNISAYIPVIHQRFNVAKSFTDNFEEEFAYPFEVGLSHTRFWAYQKLGRLYFTLSGELFWNNYVQTNSLYKTNATDYKINGGTDTLFFSDQKINEAFIGDYKIFLTPVVHIKIIYFPSESHVGISIMMEKNFRTYNILTGKLGVPIILIDKKGDPDVNFEFQVIYDDINNKYMPEKKSADKISIGLNVGIPFSKIIY
jgi:hypothetical protein